MAHRFPLGAAVRIRATHPSAPEPRHIRTPWYVRGRSGVIERHIGEFRNPEQLAEGKYDGPEVPLYWVRLTLDELWSGEGVYARGDTLALEIYEHWLEPATAAGTRAQS